LDGPAVPPDRKADVRAALARRDFVLLEELLDGTPERDVEHDLLRQFPALRGGPDILTEAARRVRNRRSARPLEGLGRVHELLRAHKLEDEVSYDLGAIRDFDYYTGVTFEGYEPDVGRPLAQGGRYDGLLAGFGRPAPATGFMLHLDLVGDVLRRSG